MGPEMAAAAAIRGTSPTCARCESRTTIGDEIHQDLFELGLAKRRQVLGAEDVEHGIAARMTSPTISSAS